MSPAEWWGLAGVFLGGAIPWLEAVVVIPAGILAGLPVLPVVIAGIVGNLLTVGVAAYAGEQLKHWWSARRERRLDAEAREHRKDKIERRRQRIERVMNRGGLPLLAILGPLGLGTQVSVVIAVGTGMRATPAFIWISAGTVLWCIVAAFAAVAGFEFLGIG